MPAGTTTNCELFVLHNLTHACLHHVMHMAVRFTGLSSQSKPESIIQGFGCCGGNWVVVAILQELLEPLGRCMGLLCDRLEVHAHSSMTVLTVKVGQEGNSLLSVSCQLSALL